MAFDWNNFILVPQDSSCHIQPGWYCDFHFGYGCDVIEEDALNEKYCIQVLRIGITNADTEIDELERDLVFLQSELAWAENEEWSDICCNALRKRIDCLYISLWNLKSKDKNNMEVSLSVKPAESLHEIIKALLRDHFQEKIKQLPDVAVLNSSGSPGEAIKVLEENKNCCSSGLGVVVKEEMEESSITPMENSTFLKTSLTLQENETNNSETVKVWEALSLLTLTSLLLLLLVNFLFLMPYFFYGQLVGDFSSHPLKGERIEHDFTPKKKKNVQDASLKSADEKRKNLEMVKVQCVDNISKNSCRNASKHAVTHSKRKKPLSISDLKIISEGSKDDSSISAADVLIVDSSLNHMGMSTNMGKNAKLVNTVVQDSGSNAYCRETGHCIDMIKPCMSYVGVSGNEEVSTCCSTVNGRSKLLISSLNSEEKKNPSKADKPVNAIVQNIKGVTWGDATSLSWGRNNSDSKLATSKQAKGGNSNTIPDALRPPSGLSGRRNDSDPGLVTSRQLKVENADGSSAALRHSVDLNQGRNNCDSRLGGFRQENGGNCDINQKLCDFALKIARKRNIKKSSLADETDSSCSSSEAEGKKKRSQLIVNTEHSVLTSTLELQDGKGTETDKTKTLTEVGTMQPEVEMAETAANDDKFNFDLSVKPQKQKAKRKAESSSLNDQEPVSHSVKTVLNSPTISKAKRRWNAGLGSDSSSSNQSWKGKMKKKFLNGQFEAEEKQLCSG
ncbi:hypothetical protein LWI29_034194 [Acer saccharum]|uniref:Uncharacterized protein n=1 Tax=Acer saccharum TaxID=4024 RepID=A0AA39SMY3_ACESA|nr:hypothetical protein LWI29_034194 [Acer saccharum]